MYARNHTATAKANVCCKHFRTNGGISPMVASTLPLSIWTNEGEGCAQNIERRWLGHEENAGQSSATETPDQVGHSHRLGKIKH